MVRHAQEIHLICDNWDLQVLRVALVMPTSEQNIVNVRGNPLIRFTGALRAQTWNR